MYHYLTAFSFIYLIGLFHACAPAEPAEPRVVEIEHPAASNSQLPNLYTDNTGQLFMSWVEADSTGNDYRLMYSRLEKDGWSEPETIKKSSRWFVNWADFPSIVGHDGRAMASHQLTKIPGNSYSYKIDLTLHTNEGWSNPITPHFDRTATEHGFLSMVPIDEQRLQAIWLDGRQTESRTDEQYFDLDRAMTLRSAVIDTSGNVTQKVIIDDSVCDCCPTSMVMTDDGPIAAYRNRTDEEIRDIYVSRNRDGEWTKPAVVHQDDWKIGACPVNGPKLSAMGSAVALAWYTAAGGEPAVKVAHSNDSGKTYAKPISVHKGSTLGRVDISLVDSTTAYLSEINKIGNGHYLTVHRISFEDMETESFEVAEIDGSRSSGFPQMEIHNEQLVLAWTNLSEDKQESSLKTVRLTKF